LSHDAASALRRRLIDQDDVTRSRGQVPLDRDKMGRGREHLDRERIRGRHDKQGADGECVAGAVYARDTDLVTPDRLSQ